MYRFTTFFILIRGIRIILTANLVSDDISAGGNTLHGSAFAPQVGADAIARSDTAHMAAMKSRILAHTAFIGEVINTDDLVIAQNFRLAAQAQLLAERIVVIVAIRSRILKRNMVPVNAGVDDSNDDAFSLAGRQAALTRPDLCSADQIWACIGLDMMNFIGKQVFDSRKATQALCLRFGQPEGHSVEQVFVAGPDFRNFSSHLRRARKKLLQALVQVFTIGHSLRAEQIQPFGGFFR